MLNIQPSPANMQCVSDEANYKSIWIVWLRRRAPIRAM